MRRLTLGISPCPNDTFVFHGLLTGAVRVDGVELELVLRDVETLNEALIEGTLEVAKASFAAALELAGTTRVLRAGAALGFGVGPLLLRRPGAPRLSEGGSHSLAEARVLCPGRWTTAHLLYRLFHPGAPAARQVVFSDVLPLLARGEADYGVCIHEGRFTYARHGLELVEDLGATWEQRTRAPLPLGGIVARASLGDELLAALTRAIRASLACARAEPEAALATMRAHAAELDDDVIRAHVALYVNEHTRDLGSEGARALAELARAAQAAGLADPQRPGLVGAQRAVLALGPDASP